VIDEESHGESSGVPAAGDKTAERALFGLFEINVEGLGVIPIGKIKDVSFLNYDRPELIHRPDYIVLKVAVIDWWVEYGMCQNTAPHLKFCSYAVGIARTFGTYLYRKTSYILHLPVAVDPVHSRWVRALVCG
jgi:hypothetical protein